MALNGLGGTIKERDRPPITLREIVLPALDDVQIENETREAAARVAERKTVRLGVDAWRLINKAQSFESWIVIGRALSVGKQHSLKSSSARQAWGSAYSRCFNDWVKVHGFERMPKSVRSVAVEMYENLPAIETWRSTLSERDRRRLVHPLSNVNRWRAAMTPRPEPDALARAEAAWRNFTRCMLALSPEQAAPLWQAVQARTAKLAPITV